MGFNCSGCGLCCTKVKLTLDNIDKAEEPYKTELKDFPYNTNKDGSCEKLVDNKCSVYEDRPLICNVEEMYEKHFSAKMSKNDYFKQGNKSCNQMIKLSGLPDKFLIDIK